MVGGFDAVQVVAEDEIHYSPRESTDDYSK